MGILDIDIVKGFMRMCNDGWLQGWHERNGGNLTYRMKEEEVAQCRPFFDEQPREWVNWTGCCIISPWSMHRWC